jgi:hypothetical protein
MTAIVNLTRAELRKLVASRTYLIGLALSVGLAVASVAADAAVAGKSGRAALGTAASTNQMLKLGSVICVAMLVLGILGSGSEYKHKTIIPAMLAATGPADRPYQLDLRRWRGDRSWANFHTERRLRAVRPPAWRVGSFPPPAYWLHEHTRPPSSDNARSCRAER